MEKQGRYVTRVSDEDLVCCEWCDKKSKAVHIGFSDTIQSNLQSTIFEDENFCCQSEWFVCGTCPGS